MSYPAISLATATVGRHRCPQKRLQTAPQPPGYPNSSPDHRACNSLTPFRCPHAVHPCPSVDSGLDEASIAEREHAMKALSALTEYSNALFERAPVMTHMIDRAGSLIQVDRRWSQILGYKRKEVAGHKSFEFLTEESRERAVKDTLPLFWRVGSARSVGYRFVKRDGRLLDLQLDAELITFPGGNCFTYAALRDIDDLAQWEQASTTLTELQELIHVRSRYERLLAVTEGPQPSQKPPEVQHTSNHSTETGLAKEALGAALELAQDISVSLRALPRVHEEWLSAMAEQQQELLQVAKSIDRTLADLADAMATTTPRPE